MTNVTKLGFPAGFTWGAATAAYQIEGAVDVDGRGPSVWDTFSHTPGKVRGGDTGDIACDSYHRYPEDADLLRSLGLDNYRFSIAWPRIIPDGAGAVNQAGLDYYKRLLDALGERGITPAATLFHWDLPQALQDKGGWSSRDTALRLADYATVVGDALGDRIKRWITLNEPLVVAHNGHRIGVHAPGLRDDAFAAATTHHLLLGHGLAAAALRASVPDAAGRAVEIGITLNLTPVRVTNDDSGSAEALEQARLIADASQNGMFLDPILFGRYPEHAPASQLPPAELILDGDLQTIAAPIDFLGVNYYQPVHLRAGDPANLRRGEKLPQEGISGPVVEFAPTWKTVTSLVLSILGLGVSIYLTVDHFAHVPLACSGNGLVNCQKVTTSAESHFLGIPVALLGLLFFVAMTAINLPAAWRVEDRRIHILRLAMAVVGMCFVLYLVSAELLIIHNICLWCTSVHLVTFLLLILTVATVPGMLGWGREP